MSQLLLDGGDGRIGRNSIVGTASEPDGKSPTGINGALHLVLAQRIHTQGLMLAHLKHQVVCSHAAEAAKEQLHSLLCHIGLPCLFFQIDPKRLFEQALFKKDCLVVLGMVRSPLGQIQWSTRNAQKRCRARFGMLMDQGDSTLGTVLNDEIREMDSILVQEHLVGDEAIMDASLTEALHQGLEDRMPIAHATHDAFSAENQVNHSLLILVPLAQLFQCAETVAPVEHTLVLHNPIVKDFPPGRVCLERLPNRLGAAHQLEQRGRAEVEIGAHQEPSVCADCTDSFHSHYTTLNFPLVTLFHTLLFGFS